MFPVPESNSFMEKKLHSVQGLVLQGVSGVCCIQSAAVFWLFHPSGQLSAEALLACSGQCLDLVRVWQVLTRHALVCLLKEARSYSFQSWNFAVLNGQET